LPVQAKPAPRDLQRFTVVTTLPGTSMHRHLPALIPGLTRAHPRLRPEWMVTTSAALESSLIRPPQGDHPLTDAERQARCSRRWARWTTRSRTLERTRLLIIDDWGPEPLTAT
jgi:hypothetical protein